MKKFIFSTWFLSILFLLFSVVAFSSGGIGILGGMAFLIGAIIVNPIFKSFLASREIVIKKIVMIPSMIVLFFVGVFLTPTSETSNDVSNDIVIETEANKEVIEVAQNEEHQVLGLENEEVVEENDVEERSIIEEETIPEVQEEEDLQVVTEDIVTPEVQEEVIEEIAQTEVNEADNEVPSEDNPPSEQTTENENVSTGDESNFNTYDNPNQQNTEATWVLNTKSKKVHHPNCKSVKKISPNNYGTSSLTLDELLNSGYTRCGNCF